MNPAFTPGCVRSRSTVSLTISEPARFVGADKPPTVQLIDVDAIDANARLAPVADSENALLNRIMVEKVMQALSELTSPQRLIFLLKHHEGMTYEEIAKAVGCSTGTAKKSVSRAVIKLREHLNIDIESPTTFHALPAEIEIGV